MSGLLNSPILAPPVVGGTTPTFIGATASAFNPSPISLALPAGSQPGDLVMVVLAHLTTASMGISGGDGGWTYLVHGPSGVNEREAYKFLTAGDIAGSLQLSSSSGYIFASVLVFRGVAACNFKSWGRNNSETPYIASGFTPGINSSVLSIFRGDTATTGSLALQPPVGFTERVDRYESPMILGVSDKADYAGGNMSWGISSSVAVQRNSNTVFELTSL